MINLTTWLSMKYHYSVHGKYPEQVQWMTPPHKYNSYTSIDEIIADIGDCDVLLFSSYVWNHDICDEVANKIRKLYPEIILVLGGPHIGLGDTITGASRSEYDYFCQPTKPGEIFIESFLNLLIETPEDLRPENIEWEWRNPKKGRSLEFPLESIYRKEVPFLKQMNQFARIHNLEPFISIETTRGCPYSCVYCEWGGGTQSRLIQKNLEVVKEDILAMKEAGFESAYLTDSNFGVFEKRDIEIFQFAYDQYFALTDISTVKSKNLDRRKRIVDAWFNVVGKGPETRYTEPTNKGKNLTGFETQFVSTLPTVSIQSISDKAMKIAQREDLNFEDKLKLSEHIRNRCHQEGYPVPALELIAGMPGSTIDDFYNEMEIIWNFKAWSSFRHDYMFLPDTSLASRNYLEEHQIELVKVYTDLVDEQGVENINSLYATKRNYFYTISSCFSFSQKEMTEMFFMNLAGNYLLKELYPVLESFMSPALFGKLSYQILSQIPDFLPFHEEIHDLFNPKSPPRNIKRLLGKLRRDSVEQFIEKSKVLLMNQLFIEVSNVESHRTTASEKTRDMQAP